MADCKLQVISALHTIDNEAELIDSYRFTWLMQQGLRKQQSVIYASFVSSNTITIVIGVTEWWGCGGEV